MTQGPKPPPRRRKKRKTSNVPSQALGFSLQFTRMAALLFEASPGTLVSFEVFDDVGETARGGKKTYVQTKSALVTNPLSDRSVELWKTLANWIDAVAEGPRDPSMLRFVIYVSRPVSGDLAEKFQAAKSRTEADVAISDARKLLWGNGPAFKLRSALSPNLAPYVERVFSALPDVAASVIQAFEIECGSGSPQTDFLQIMDRLYVPQSRIETVANYAAGWVKREVDKLLETNKPAVLARDDFHKEMTTFIRKVAERDILHSFAPEPSDAQKKELLPRLFVQQLELIALDFSDQLEAMSQFFRAAFDRTKWGESGDVNATSLDELDERLMQTWKNIKRKTLIQAANKDDSQKGQLLYSDCMLHNDKLEGLETPSHFVPGCFHLLADELKIGWHPAYLKKFPKKRERLAS